VKTGKVKQGFWDPPPPRGPLTRGAITHAFRRAQDELGSSWLLKGRGHCPRATLQAHISGPAALGANKSWQDLSIGASKRRVFPFRIIRRAAKLLRLSEAELMGRVFHIRGRQPGTGR